MIKEAKYMIISILNNIKNDYNYTYKNMDKPKEIMNLLFYLFFIQLFMGKYQMMPVTLVLYIVVYCWKVIKRGDWRHLMRKDYLKTPK